MAKAPIIFISGWAMPDTLLDGVKGTIYSLSTIHPENVINQINSLCATHDINKFHLMGYSLGGLIAAKLSAILAEKICTLTLISVRPQFPNEVIDPLIGLYNKKPLACLQYFYKQCFSSSTQLDNFSKKHQLFIEALPKEALLKGLLYLKTHTLPKRLSLANNNITFIHGKNDNIAPLNEIEHWLKKNNIGHDLQLFDQNHYFFDDLRLISLLNKIST